MNLLLLDCNKVSQESFAEIAKSRYVDQINIQVDTLSKFDRKADVLSYNDVHEILANRNLDAVLVADIFWPTGQNICKWCLDNKVKCCFLQHGQWIYITNKRNPQFVPHVTFLLGDNVYQECSTWPYSARSKLVVSGSPRYDPWSSKQFAKSERIYLSSPVILELSPSVRPKYHPSAYALLKKLVGLDDEVELLIHPHYREGMLDDLSEMFPNAELADPKENALQLIAKSDKVITHRDSTTVLDAIALHKHVVLINFPDTMPSAFPAKYFYPFASETSNLTECIDCLRKTNETITDYEQKSRAHIFLGESSKHVIEALRI